MTADDKSGEPRSREFTVRIPSGTIVFSTPDIDAGQWWLELRARGGSLLQRVTMHAGAVADLYRQSREAYRLERFELEPDFFSLAASRENLRDGHGRKNPRHRQFASIFNALGYATTRPSDRVDRLLEELSETCARFLAAEGETRGLAPRLRGRKGKRTDEAWADVTEPVQEAMVDLATEIVPALLGASSFRQQGTVVIRNHLRGTCAAAMDRFAWKVVDAASNNVGDGHAEPLSVSKRIRAGATRTQAQIDELAECLEERVADAFHGLKEVPPNPVLLRALSLDPEDFDSVKWVVRQAYGVLMPGPRADSLIRSFKLAPPKLNAAGP
jgi:hypothetical protein